MFTVINVVIWVFLFYRWNSSHSSVPSKIKIQHGLFTFSLIGSVNFFKFFNWIIYNPHAFINEYYKTIGFLPNYLIFLNEILYLIFDLTMFIIACNILRNKERATFSLLRILPYYLVTSLINIIFELHKLDLLNSLTKSIVSTFISYFLIIIFYSWMFLFYRSKNINSMLNLENVK